MSKRTPASKELQPSSFVFSKENQALAKNYIAKYPKGREASSVISLLDLAQRQNNNWLPLAAIEHVAEILSIPVIKAMEIATFYTMFNLAPVGKYHIQLCGTTPCWLRGASDIKDLCKKKLDINLGETSKDGIFSLCEVECLGACANAPIVQINDDFYEDLDLKSMEKIIDDLSKGIEIKTGSQIGRKSSERSKF